MRRAVGAAPEFVSAFGGITDIAEAERRNERFVTRAFVGPYGHFEIRRFRFA
jgi:hypothetical protein